MEKSANLLKRSFNTPVFELDGRVTIKSIDRGSVWIIIGIVGAGTILKMCANLIWAAVVVRNKSKEAAIMEEHARTIKLKNDLLEALIQQHKNYIEQSKETEAAAIVSEFVHSKNPETVQQFKTSIEAIGTLIEKGAEFYPSLKAPQEVKELFPDFSIANLIESKIKLLDKGDSE